MATLTRQTQKVFAGSANADQIAVMGSMKTGTPDYQTSLALLQSAEYQQGWADAILNDKAPYLEEMNGVQYGFSYQLAYLLQEGLPEYDANTAYGLTSIVKVISGNELILYHPIQLDANGECKGHALGDTAWWARLYFTSTTAIGNPQFTLKSTLPPSCIWLDGSAVSRTTYASLFAIYGTTYGPGDGSTTFNLPNFENRTIWGATSFGTINAGLPNITASTDSKGAHTHTRGTMNIKGSISSTDAAEALVYPEGISVSGALYLGNKKTNFPTFVGSASGGVYQSINFDASRSGAWTGATSSNGAHTHNVTVTDNGANVLNKSTTVQPPAIKVRVYTRYE